MIRWLQAIFWAIFWTLFGPEEGQGREYWNHRRSGPSESDHLRDIEEDQVQQLDRHHITASSMVMMTREAHIRAHKEGLWLPPSYIKDLEEGPWKTR
jgi:hypothetical protein